jgi:hypothetical protein
MEANNIRRLSVIYKTNFASVCLLVVYVTTRFVTQYNVEWRGDK